MYQRFQRRSASIKSTKGISSGILRIFGFAGASASLRLMVPLRRATHRQRHADRICAVQSILGKLNPAARANFWFVRPYEIAGLQAAIIFS
jgi:hypothetical protein